MSSAHLGSEAEMTPLGFAIFSTVFVFLALYHGPRPTPTADAFCWAMAVLFGLLALVFKEG
jgi:hypothetical protein